MNEPVLEVKQPEEPVQIVVEHPRSGTAVVRVTGDLDLRTTPLLRERLQPLLEQHGAVLVDLQNVGFLGSTGLAELTAAQDAATSHGTQLRLVATGHAVLRPLQVTGLDALFQIFDSVDEALADL
jgi:anti-sigma B factor antagonist